MFKRLETAWNSRTPEYLHNGTKANIIWQLKMTALFIVGMYVHDKAQDFRQNRRRNKEDQK